MSHLVAVERTHDLPDVLIGSRLRICDDESGCNYSEGVVASVDRVGAQGTGKELLRLLVERRVVNGKAVADFLREVAVDCEIPLHRVTLVRPRTSGANAEKHEVVLR